MLLAVLPAHAVLNIEAVEAEEMVVEQGDVTYKNAGLKILKQDSQR
jgi:hypothetical protein